MPQPGSGIKEAGRSGGASASGHFFRLCLAAAVGICWQDGKILSTHGISEEDWIPEFLDAAAHREKTFLITSGAKDVQRMGQLLAERHRGNCICHIGCNLGTAQEQILRLPPEACKNFEEPGLCTVLVENPDRSLAGSPRELGMMFLSGRRCP